MKYLIGPLVFLAVFILSLWASKLLAILIVYLFFGLDLDPAQGLFAGMGLLIILMLASVSIRN